MEIRTLRWSSTNRASRRKRRTSRTINDASSVSLAVTSKWANWRSKSPSLDWRTLSIWSFVVVGVWPSPCVSQEKRSKKNAPDSSKHWNNGPKRPSCSREPSAGTVQRSVTSRSKTGRTGRSASFVDLRLRLGWKSERFSRTWTRRRFIPCTAKPERAKDGSKRRVRRTSRQESGRTRSGRSYRLVRLQHSFSGRSEFNWINWKRRNKRWRSFERRRASKERRWSLVSSNRSMTTVRPFNFSFSPNATPTPSPWLSRTDWWNSTPKWSVTERTVRCSARFTPLVFRESPPRRTGDTRGRSGKHGHVLPESKQPSPGWEILHVRSELRPSTEKTFFFVSVIIRCS